MTDDEYQSAHAADVARRVRADLRDAEDLLDDCQRLEDRVAHAQLPVTDSCPQWMLDAFNEQDAEYARIAWNALLSEGEVTYHEASGIGRGILTRWSNLPPRQRVLVVPLLGRNEP